jgi:6-phosphogluconolactonase (cycloisomerase 2 family)
MAVLTLAKTQFETRWLRVPRSFSVLLSLLALQVGCGSAEGDSTLALKEGSSCAIQNLKTNEDSLAPQFVYAANQNSHDISSYAVGANGALSPVGSPISVGRYPEGIALHPSGRSLFVADHGSNTVSVLSVDSPSGRLSPNGSPVVNAGSGPLAVVAHPGGRWLFVGNDDAQFGSPNAVTTYEVDVATDRLQQASSSETGSAGLLAMTLDRSGHFLYTANTLGDDVTAFKVDECTGSLTKVGDVPAPFPVALSAGKSGEFLYVASNGPAPSLRTFAIDPVSGVLNQVASIGGAFLPWSLRAMRLDTSGEFLVLVSLGERNSAFISTLAIDPGTGEPSPTPVSSVLAGDNATDVAISPAGRFAYVSNFGSNDISSFSLDPAHGTVTPLGSVPAGTAPSALVIATGPTQ